MSENPGITSTDGALDGQAPDSSDGPDGSTDAADGSSRGPRPGGSLSITQIRDLDGGYLSSASVSFTSSPQGLSSGVQGPGCSSTTNGACIVSVCDYSDGGATPPVVDAGPPPTAGEITFTGGLIPPPGIVLVPNAYQPKTFQSQLFYGGEAITVTATGDIGSIPAFKREVTAPAEIYLTKPPSTGNQTTVSRQAPFEVAWNGGFGSTNVAVSLSTFNVLKSAYVTCLVNGTSNSITIPAADLEKLPVGEATFGVAVINHATFAVADYDLSFGIVTTSGSAKVTIVE